MQRSLWKDPCPISLENALHQIYIDKGWNFDLERNKAFSSSKDANKERQSLLFPTMQDLKEKIDSVVAEAGYADELDRNLKAALKTRISNLTLGTKGKIYNSRHCLSTEILFERPTIIELSYIADDCEKSFLMGLLLQKLYRYQESKGDSGNSLRHLCVIEEAHRLLPNISLDKNLSDASPKAAAIQVFVNILAEIRSLGEGIIIADQIASKLHPDVIKNTSLKIIHRTMDKEDRERVGDSINLTQNQILDIASLQRGEAIVHHKNTHEAFLVGISHHKTSQISDEDIAEFYQNFNNVYPYYQYRYLNERSFYLPNSLEVLAKIQSISSEKRQKTLLEVLDSLLLKDTPSLLESLNNFRNLYDGESKVTHKIHGYLFAETFEEFHYIGNAQYYHSIDSYKDTHEILVELILEQDANELEEICKEVKKCFWHKNIKEIFPSMQNYDKKSIDYTLLLLEHLRLNQNLRETLGNQVQRVIEHYKYSLKDHFKLASIPKDLLASLIAVRAGNEIIETTSIIEEEL